MEDTSVVYYVVLFLNYVENQEISQNGCPRPPSEMSILWTEMYGDNEAIGRH
jgi:hypothetical protein